jgi:hypothetical protein
MEVTTREAERIFAKLKVAAKRSTHHVAGIVDVNGVPTLPVHYSHGRHGLHGRAAHLFRKSLKLETAEFSVLKGCTMSREEYLALVGPRVKSSRASTTHR